MNEQLIVEKILHFLSFQDKYCYRIKLNALSYVILKRRHYYVILMDFLIFPKDFKRFSCNFFEELSVRTYREPVSTQLETFASENGENDVVEMLQSLKMRKSTRLPI